MPHDAFLPSRRLLLGSTLAGAVAAGLAACSSGETTSGSGNGTAGPANSTGTPTASGTALMPPGEGKTTYPLTLKTPWGETTLAKRPERVADLDPIGKGAELLLALGVTPVAMSKVPVKNAPWTMKAGGDRVETTFESVEGKPPMEIVAKADPDLLVWFGSDLKTDYAKVKDVAPVLSASSKVEDYYEQPTWQEQIRAIGAALDLAGRAEKFITDHDAYLAEQKRKHPEFAGRSANFLVWRGPGSPMSNFAAQGQPADRLFTALGFAPSRQKNGTPSLENLSSLDGDVLVLGFGGQGTDGVFKGLTDQGVWKRLNVVKSGRVVELDPKTTGFPVLWALGAGTVLGVPWLLDRLLPPMSAKLGAGTAPSATSSSSASSSATSSSSAS